MLLSWLPKSAYGIIHELTRHILRRPVVGISAVARTRDGRTLLIRRADTGTWGLPGGTLEWGETLRVALDRELEEEAGVVGLELVRVLGVWSRPSRDPRFHAVTVGVECLVDPRRQARARARFRIVAQARAGEQRARVLVEGSDVYGLTARFLVEAALRVAAPGAPTGALAPAQALPPREFLNATGGADLRWRVL